MPAQRVSRALNIIGSIFCVPVSMGFIYFGVALISTAHETPLVAVATLFYGIASICLLVLSWMSAAPPDAPRLMATVAIGYMTVFVIGCMDTGLISGLEWLWIAALAIVLSFQFWTVRNAVHHAAASRRITGA